MLRVLLWRGNVAEDALQGAESAPTQRVTSIEGEDQQGLQGMCRVREGLMQGCTCWNVVGTSREAISLAKWAMRMQES